MEKERGHALYHKCGVVRCISSVSHPCHCMRKLSSKPAKKKLYTKVVYFCWVSQDLRKGRMRATVEKAFDIAAAHDDGPFYYMVVGFEVSPCSIKRQAGQPIEEVACGYENENRFGPQVCARQKGLVLVIAGATKCKQALTYAYACSSLPFLH
eukprot:1139485-Pelagomonas_calceolata.AAC.13